MGLDKVIGILLICMALAFMITVVVGIQANGDIYGWKDESIRKKLIILAVFWVSCTAFFFLVLFCVGSGIHLIVRQ